MMVSKSKTRVQVEPTGYVVALRRGREVWFCEDLAYLTNDEFMEWLISVYPFFDIKECNPSEYSSRESRLQTMDAVIAFHQTKLFSKPKG